MIAMASESKDLTTPEGIAKYLVQMAENNRVGQPDAASEFCRGYRYALRTAADEICRKNNIRVLTEETYR